MPLVTYGKARDRRDKGSLVGPPFGPPLGPPWLLLSPQLPLCSIPLYPCPSISERPWWGLLCHSEGIFSLGCISEGKVTMQVSSPLPRLPQSPTDLAKWRRSQPHASNGNVRGLTWPLSVFNVPTTALQVTAQETNMPPVKYGAIILKLKRAQGSLILFLLCPHMLNSYMQL